MIRVAIFDPLPAYRAGLAAALHRANFLPEETVDDPMLWASKNEGLRGALVTVDHQCDLALIEKLRLGSSEIIIVAMSSDPGSEEACEAINLGCHGIVDRHAHPDVAPLALRAALLDHSVLPLRTLGDVTRGLSAVRPTSLKPWQIEWLRALARGSTVHELAGEVGYSPREMYRKLGEVYRLLGADRRTAALLIAVRQGLL